jgi:hypothetical protein
MIPIIIKIPSEKCDEAMKIYQENLREVKEDEKLFGVVFSQWGDIVISMPLWLALKIHSAVGAVAYPRSKTGPIVSEPEIELPKPTPPPPPLYLYRSAVVEIKIRKGGKRIQVYPPRLKTEIEIHYSPLKRSLKVSEEVHYYEVNYEPNPEVVEIEKDGHPVWSYFNKERRFVCGVDDSNKPETYGKELDKHDRTCIWWKFGTLRGLNEWFDVAYWRVKREFAPFGFDLRRYEEGGELRRVMRVEPAREGKDDVCLVCKEAVDEHDWVMDCCHVVHRWCRNFVYRYQKCPYCQKPVRKEDAEKVEEVEDEEESEG